VLKQRVITGVILAPIVLALVLLLSPAYFAWFVAAVVALGAWEWAQFCPCHSQLQRVLYAAAVLVAVYLSALLPEHWVLGLSMSWWLLALVLIVRFPDSARFWSTPLVRALIGLLVLVPLWQALVLLRQAVFSPAPEFTALWLILYVLVLVWIADIGAYFAGKAWGRTKLAPKVSPGKSWAGFWGGLVLVMLYAGVVTQWLALEWVTGLTFIAVSAVVGVLSVVGDLNESMFKRVVGLKDSSQLLPGHGGILDRIDSLTAAVPVFTFLLLLFAWV
jgi:phosphatidate cytidylyltransferase